MNKAFTLIELLVVVLIIGILSAIALPQYQVARDKALISTYLPILRGIKYAEEVAYMENGSYEREFSKLDIDVTQACTSVYHNMLFGCKQGYINMVYTGTVKGELSFVFCPSFSETTTLSNYVSCYQNSEASIVIYFDHHPEKAGKVECWTTTDRGRRICQMFK